MRCEDDIRVDEYQHRSVGLCGKSVTGPRFAEPPLRGIHVIRVEELDSRIRPDDISHDIGCAVGGAVIEDDDLELVYAFLGEQGFQAGCHPVGLVTQGQQDRDTLRETTIRPPRRLDPGEIDGDLSGKNGRGKRPSRDNRPPDLHPHGHGRLPPASLPRHNFPRILRQSAATRRSAGTGSTRGSCRRWFRSIHRPAQ